MLDKEVQVNVLDLQVAKPTVVRILLAQPTWKATDWIERHGLAFLKDTAPAQEWLDRFLSLATARAVDMIILPELSVPERLLETVRSWSAQTGAIAIAGSHYFSRNGRYFSRCPVITAGTVHFVEKLTPAPVETSPIEGEGLAPGVSQIIFKNTAAGNFAVLICSDFLDSDVKRLVYGHDLDLLCVPAFQRNSTAYHSRMNIDCEESELGLYIAYANSLCREFGDGRSALFGLMDNMFIEKLLRAGATDRQPEWKLCELSTHHSSLVVEVSLSIKKPLAKRTVHTRPNVVVIELGGTRDAISEAFGQTIGRSDARYIQIQDYFVAPREYDSILNLMESARIVFIVGDPGMGKTYTAVRLLKHYFEKGYTPVWFAGLEREDRTNQRMVLEQFRPVERQIAYFEDPFGRTHFERRESIRSVFGPLRDHLREVDAKVVITSRKEIFEQFVAEVPTSLELQKLTRELNVVKPSYSPAALATILEKLANDAAWFKDEHCRRMVLLEIEKGTLASPLAIRDFVYSTERVSSTLEVLARLNRRGVEEKALFAEEISATSIETRLVLALVFLFGNHPTARLSEWFNQVCAYFNPTRPWAGSSPFFAELRPQLGFRVEQYGVRAITLRFAHPSYEEAFAIATEKDAVTFDLTTTLMKLAARTQMQSTMIALSRQAGRHPLLTARLLEALIPVIKAIPKLVDFAAVGTHLLRLRSHSWEHQSEFDNLLMETVSLQDVIKRINAETDLQVLTQALRFGHNLTSTDITNQSTKQLVDGIDWARIRNLCFIETNFAKVVPFLAATHLINRDLVNKFLDSIPPRELVARLQTLHAPEQAVIYRIASNSSAYRHIGRTIGRQFQRRLWRKELLRGWEERGEHRNQVVVDDGAWDALANGFNLLPAGVLSASGEFRAGETVSVFGEDGAYLGAGIPAYGVEDINAIRGQHSMRIPELVSAYNGAAVIRRTQFVPSRTFG